MASLNSSPLSVYPIALPQEPPFGDEIFMTSLLFLLFVLLLDNNRMHERVKPAYRFTVKVFFAVVPVVSRSGASD